MKKFFFFCFIFISALCFAENIEWKLTRDSEAYDGNYDYAQNIKANEIVNARSTLISLKDGDMKYDYAARIYSEGIRLSVDAEAIIPNGTQDLLDENLLTPAVSRRGKTWFNAHSIPILQSKNRETTRQFEEKTLKFVDSHSEGYWYNDAYMGEEMDLFQVIIKMLGIQTEATFYITNIQKRNTHYVLTGICDEWYHPDSTIPIEDQPVKGEKTELLLYPDGEYLDIYVKKTNNYLWSFVQVNEEYQKQFWTLIRPGAWYPDNVFNLNKVIFPLRADKSHSVGITCIVAESLRLREEENTSSATIQIMQPGTQVQIWQLGKKETIDGISANWVQVEVSVSTSVQGTDVRRATGWCFGGYLVEK